MGLFKKFRDNEAGNLAVIFAVSALPVALIGTAALDMRYAENVNNNLQNALDATALAVVANPNLSETKRHAFAEGVFTKNFISKYSATLSYPKEEDSDVFTVAGTVNVPTTLGAMINMTSTNIAASSSAVLEDEGSVCVLALAEDGANRVQFSDNAAFSAPNCSVQVNSVDPLALMNSGTSIPKSAGFCAVGAGRGSFSPAINSECAPVKDPYANLDAPENAPCISFDNAGALFSQFSLAYNTRVASQTSGDSEESSEQSTGSNVRMWPGTYCRGLTVDGIDVQFMPGTYTIRNGNLTFKNISQAEALGVTFILQDDAKLNVELGAQLKVKAPSDGEYAGMAFYQVPASPSDEEGAAPISYPTAVSTLSSGGKLDVEGTLYFPTQALEILGESYFGSQARATSFIAYEVAFSGDTIAQVSVDYRAAGLPPLEPRITGGPRLVR